MGRSLSCALRHCSVEEDTVIMKSRFRNAVALTCRAPAGGATCQAQARPSMPTQDPAPPAANELNPKPLGTAKHLQYNTPPVIA